MILGKRLFQPVRPALDYALHKSGTVDNNTYTVTVPDDEQWVVDWLHVNLVSSATVGNRQIRISINDGTEEVMDSHAGQVQAASLTRHYLVLPGIFRETAFVDGEIQIPIPRRTVLKPGWKIIVYDSNDVDATLDDLVVNIAYEKVL